MNFSFGVTNTPKGAGDAGNTGSNTVAPKNLFGTQTTQASGAAPSFTFGTSSAPAPTFGFSANPAQQSAPGNAGSTTATPAFGFPTNTTQQQPAQGFSFGAAKTTAPTLSFGTTPQATTTTQPTTGFGLLSNTASTASSGFGSNTTSFGLAPTTTTSAGTTGTGLNFGFGAKTTTAAPAATTPSFSFGNTAKTTASTLSFGLSTTTTASTTALPTFGAVSSTPATCSATTTTTTVAGTGFSVGTGLNLSTSLNVAKTTTTSTFATGFSLPASTSSTTVATSLAGFGTTPVSSKASGALTTTVMSGNTTVPIASMNFSQLEENINKWTLDLDEQVKIFMNQATQVNAWDQLLIENGEKIVMLNDNVERIKLDQFALDHELDFIVSQQIELEDMIAPLERELSQISIRDPEREQSYQLAENLDTQLKQMAEDLKEVIEHLNESNKAQDVNDPIVQVGRILNAHMSSLQWIDASTAQINAKLQQVERMQETLRSSTERAFHRTFD
ncbi:nuclear pore glycoprotein p62-like [Ctenocephalides felis]|uniref:nuclear pore glycoprotein p62-like n=1 Tax=Ctenocephalides felis TaxID=7515 RepID=UPI000E6E1BBF|nr:nuclear pore glycoprotein p62-like [Ctenocephalides felis]